MITEKDMQYVLTIANYGNMTKAANALFLSQPALSIHLKQLETSIGIPLFERRGRRMILTYAGEEFVKSAREITMKCFELEDRMQDIGKNVAVKLNIGYMVRQIATLFPAVRISQTLSTVCCLCHRRSSLNPRGKSLIRRT